MADAEPERIEEHEEDINEVEPTQEFTDGETTDDDFEEEHKAEEPLGEHDEENPSVIISKLNEGGDSSIILDSDNEELEDEKITPKMKN